MKRRGLGALGRTAWPQADPVSTATDRALLGALSKGKCPGLRGGQGTHLWLATLTLVQNLSPGPEGGTRRDGEWPWWGVENGLGVRGQGEGWQHRAH